VIKRGKGLMLKTAAFNSMEGVAGLVELEMGETVTEESLIARIATTARCEVEDISDSRNK